MSPLRKLFTPLADFFSKYPAVLSGYIIYAYLFIATMDFYRKVKEATHTLFDYVQNFDALLWMWLLAWALVKVMEYRSRLNEEEQRRMEHERQAEIHLVQLQTLKEVIRTLQHDINNPLAIIVAYAHRVEKVSHESPDVLASIAEIKGAAERISSRLTDFSQAEAYVSVPSPVGQLAALPSRHDPS
jgi:signal transduction histidine kinase